MARSDVSRGYKRSAKMTRRTGLLLLVAGAIFAAPAAAHASLTLIDVQPDNSVRLTLAAAPYVGFNRIEAQSGGAHGSPAAIFEPPVFRNLGSWSDTGSDTSTSGVATGPRVVSGQALVFDLYLAGSLDHSFAFDFYAFDSARGTNALDFDAHVAYVYNSAHPSASYWAITPEASTGANIVPEPAAFLVWALTGSLAIAAGWWRRRKR
jgi:hypothetical protein